MKYINEYNDYEKNLLYQGDNKVKFYIASLIKDLEIKYHVDYPRSTFFVNKYTRDIWMEDDKILNLLWVSDKNVWSKIKSLYPFKDLKISKLVKHTVEVAFNLNVNTARVHGDEDEDLRWRMVRYKLINESNSYENKLFSQVNSKPVVHIASLLKDLEIKYDKRYPRSTFFVHKETGEVWMEDNKNFNSLIVSEEDIWLNVSALFSHDYSLTSDAIQYTVEVAFKMEVGAPEVIFSQTSQRRWISVSNRIQRMNNLK